jgi:hypothetical protein
MKKEISTSTAAVVYKIHIHTPHQHIAKLFINNVPEEVTKVRIRRNDNFLWIYLWGIWNTVGEPLYSKRY